MSVVSWLIKNFHSLPAAVIFVMIRKNVISEKIVSIVIRKAGATLL